MRYEIEMCTKENMPTIVKGGLLEKLASEILEVQQYKVVETVRITGMEIDVLARHKINNTVIFVECKAWDSPLSADVITKLLGNVVMKNANGGWLITTGTLSKDAKGLQEEWENKDDEKRQMLSFYTSDRIIELLLDTKLIRKCPVIKEKLEEGYEQGDTALLLVTDIGKYWVVPIVAKDTGLVMSVTAFEANSGNHIEDTKIIEELKNRKNKYSSYEWLTTQQQNKVAERELLNEYNSVVPIITGDSWNDYRPARPEDFVGRKQNIKEILSFFDNVIENKTDSRLFAIKGPSGMGKSSLISKLIAVANSAKRKKKYFIYSVDVRTALSQRYAEFALRACIAEAQKVGFLNIRSTNIEMTSADQIFQEDYFVEALDNLKKDDKCIVLIFDQFEELFSKKELWDLFYSIRNLSNLVDAEKRNFILGFAWKTDSFVPLDHPAYEMWSSLRDRRKEFTIVPFSVTEIRSAINIFGKQLGDTVNPVLRNYLINQCQGYPWLLKKLCIHVFELKEDYYVFRTPEISKIEFDNERRRSRSRFGMVATGLFWGQSSPEKVMEVWHLIKNGENNYLTLKGNGYRNAIEVLTTTIGIERRGNRLVILQTLDEVFKTINESDTICYVKLLIEENENIKGPEVGEKLNDKFHRKWLKSSKLRYGNALLLWSKFLNQN